MRIFYVLYPADVRLSLALDAIRLLANPYAKDRAHLTVRGPCGRHYQSQTLSRLNQKISGAQIHIEKPDAFWGARQSTINLSCSAVELKSVWHKPDYDYHPHITLYDGDSRSFSEALLELLVRGFPQAPRRLSFRAPSLSPLITVKGQASLMLPTSVDLRRLGTLVGRELPLTAIAALPPESRLSLIETVWRHLGEAAETVDDGAT